MLNASLIVMKRVYKMLGNLAINKAGVHISDLPAEVREKYSRKDGKDTIGLDIVAEDIISIGGEVVAYGGGHYSLFQRIYDISGVIITEERGRIPRELRIEHNTPILISDPVDGTAPARKLIEDFGKDSKNMKEVFAKAKQAMGDSARLTSSNSSVTLLKDNRIVFSIILNLITGEIYVAYERGVFVGHINKVTDVEKMKTRVRFADQEGLTMLCYTKGEKYQNNRLGTHLRFFPVVDESSSPIGPLRFAYLMADSRGKPLSDISIIAHNGEKIQEALPNIAVAFFSGGELQAYKLFCDREYHSYRAGMQLTPNIANSIYRGLIINTGLRLTFLNNHDYPSQFRDTTVIVPTANEAGVTMMRGMVERGFAMQIV